jgi:hypothetical protein
LRYPLERIEICQQLKQRYFLGHFGMSGLSGPSGWHWY